MVERNRDRANPKTRGNGEPKDRNWLTKKWLERSGNGEPKDRNWLTKKWLERAHQEVVGAIRERRTQRPKLLSRIRFRRRAGRRQWA